MDDSHNSKDTVYKHYNVQDLICINGNDENGNPTGGIVTGMGINVKWQDGPRTPDVEGNLAPANGAFVEDVIYTALQRLQWFQDSKFKTRENAIAITNLEQALWALNHRRLGRQLRKVEGKHEV